MGSAMLVSGCLRLLLPSSTPSISFEFHEADGSAKSVGERPVKAVTREISNPP
jgi:hypothetical protein